MTSPTGERPYRLAVVNSHPIQYFAPLYRRIAESSDIEIMVYYCSRQGLEEGFVDPGFGKEVVWDVPLLEGYPHKFLPNVGGDRGARGFFSLVNPSIISELWRGKYDAVLIHGHSHATNLLAMCTAKLSGTRVFMRNDTHLLLQRTAFKRLLRRPVMSLFYRFCDACLYIGTRNLEFYRAHGVPPRKLFSSPFAVDNDFFATRARAARPECNARRAALGLPPDLPVIIAPSKLTSQKRPRDLLHAHAELIRRGIPAALLFVGDGPERARLEQEVSELGLAHVKFVGFANQTVLPVYYAMADVCVLPSGNETWGLAINEAMACGVPVVTTNEVGAAADLVRDGKTGFVYETGDIRALADALATVVAGDELGRSLQEACVHRMALWSHAQSIEGLNAALHMRPSRQG